MSSESTSEPSPFSSVPQGKVLLRESTTLPPCSTIVHPECNSLLILGTYQLEESTRSRHGSLEFWLLVPDSIDENTLYIPKDDTKSFDKSSMRKIGQLNTESSILDVKLHPADPNILISAQSTGEIIIWKFQDLAGYAKHTLESLEAIDNIPSVNDKETSTKEIEDAPNSEDSVVKKETEKDQEEEEEENEFYQYTDPSLVMTLKSGLSNNFKYPAIPLVSSTHHSVTDNDPDILVLSLAISPVHSHSTLSATLTTGDIAICHLSYPELDFSVVRTIHEAHSLEAWISNFHHLNDNLLFSGGDDAVLAAHDLRIKESGGNSSDDDEDAFNIAMGIGGGSSNGVTVWKARNIHSAGVTSIMPLTSTNPNSNPYILWTGGYDDNLKTVDIRAIDGKIHSYMKPRAVSEMNLGGGVWKLIPNPANEDTVLACCMYGGARLLKRNAAFSTVEDLSNDEPATVVKSLTEGHKSMVYGGSWINRDTVLTCSFYDKSIQIWT